MYSPLLFLSGDCVLQKNKRLLLLEKTRFTQLFYLYGQIKIYCYTVYFPSSSSPSGPIYHITHISIRRSTNSVPSHDPHPDNLLPRHLPSACVCNLSTVISNQIINGITLINPPPVISRPTESTAFN